MPIRVLTTLFCLVAGTQGLAQVTIPNFRLLDHQGRSHELYRQASEYVLIYIAGDTPAPPSDIEALAQFAKEKDAFNVFLLATTPDPALVEHAGSHLPLLLDEAGIVLNTLDAAAAAELFVIATEDWQLLYRGPLLSEGEVTRAVEEGRGLNPEHASLSRLALPHWPNPDFARDVAPILAEKCATCHRKGETAPFAFDSHRRAAGWASMIREVLLTDRMPPWNADPEHGHFANNRDLTPDEVRTLVAWVDAGAPPSAADPLSDQTHEPRGTWRLGEPDLVIGMAEPFEVPAEGVLEYQLLRMPSGLSEDRWLRGLEVLPGNPAVLHHALIFIEYPEHLKAMEPQVSGGARGYFAGFVPGVDPAFFPEGTGKFVPAGSTFIFQIHYVTTGKPETDQTRLGLHFLAAPPKIRIETTAAYNAEFEIPPHAEDFEVAGQREIRAPMVLYALGPHMHYRGSRFKYIAQYPSGKEEVLLSVPNYNFDWQTQYILEQPKLLPGGTRIKAVGAFDNSERNPYNPNPAATVRFGDQTYEEMFIGYMDLGAPPAFYERMAERRARAEKQGRGQMREEDRQRALAGEPLTPESIIGSAWREDDWKFRFLADGIFLVNDLIKGKWRWEENRVIIDVVGEHFELDVFGSGLFFDGSHPITRLE